MAAPAQLRSLLKGAFLPNGKCNPVQFIGSINPYTSLMAEKRGAKVLYLSGSGVATASYGYPDLGITQLPDVIEDVRRITRVCKLPLFVDVDTGFGDVFGIARTVRDMEAAGASGFHIEDQVAEKRCGHRPGKQIVSTSEMVARITAAVEARSNKDFVIMARTDSYATAEPGQGLTSVLKRCEAYLNAGADALFPEAMTKLSEYESITRAFPGVPVLANITEFGATPLYNTKELGDAGIAIALYPLSAHRAMAKAADTVFQAIIKEGSQASVVDIMQTRKELYEMLGYHKFEEKLDSALKQRLQFEAKNNATPDSKPRQ